MPLYVFLFLASFLLANELPKAFSQLSTPLYVCSASLDDLSCIESLEPMLQEYKIEAENLKRLGFEVDKTQDKQRLHTYLKKLREFQKKYDYILHEIHLSINKSIDTNDYKLFVKLTKYEFDGLLRSRALFKKALEFYEKNRLQGKIPFFEKKIEHQELEVATTEEFYNIATSSEYDSQNITANKNKKVKIEVVDVGKSMIVYVENKNPYTITIKLKSNYTNLDYDRSARNQFPIAPGVKKEYIRLKKQRGALSYSYRFSYSWIIGSVDAVHDDSYVYRLPFAKGTRHRVSQGYNGKTTHKGRSKYAIDFAMDIGTKVYAARDGRVVKTKRDSNKGGYDRKYASSGNYITIEHSDTTLATYYHLKNNGVLVNVGDKVSKGMPIGYSGNTGYSSGPHLHLAVFKASGATKTQTVPIKFLSKRGVIEEPKKNIFYVAK